MSAQAKVQAALAQAPLRGFEGLASRLKSHELAVETKYEQRKDGSSSAEFSLVPGPGTHYFRYQEAWFQVSLIPMFAENFDSDPFVDRSSVNERRTCSICSLGHRGRQ